MTVQRITQEQASAIWGNPAIAERLANHVNLRIDKYNGANVQQETYISAEEARALGADTQAPSVVQIEPHAALHAEYAGQVAEGTIGFYLWECDWSRRPTGFIPLWKAPEFSEHMQYRYTDISCYVSKDGEPAIRMLRTAAKKLQAETKDVCNWFGPEGLKSFSVDGFNFSRDGIYTYKRRESLVKLDGELMTREAAIAKWESKKDMFDVYSVSTDHGYETWEKTPKFGFLFVDNFEYKLRAKPPKQVSWSRVPVGVLK